MKAYAIKNWKLHYERNHKESEVVFRWVGMPTKHDGKSYRRLARQPDAIPVFLAFFLMVQVAAKMPVRGLLADESGPLDADDLADETGYPSSIFQSALKLLIDPKIDWIEYIEVLTSPNVVGTSSPTGQDRTGQYNNPIPPPAGDGGESSPQGDANADTAERQRSLKSDTEEPPGFMAWWKDYPYLKKFPSRKKGRAKCKRLWVREKLETVAEQVIACLRRCKASHDWTREDGRFVPGPEVFLNGAPWQTEVEPDRDAKVSDQLVREAKHREAQVQAEKSRLEEERQAQITTLRQLSPEQLSSLKRECVEAADPIFKKRMDAADPFAGKMLSTLMCARLRMEEAEVSS